MDIVVSGVESIRTVLFSDNSQEKDSLVFCLDRYLDLYFGYCLPYHNDIIALLQECLFLPNSIALKEDILNLLSMYATCPLTILEQRCHELEIELQPEARCILHES